MKNIKKNKKIILIGIIFILIFVIPAIFPKDLPTDKTRVIIKNETNNDFATVEINTLKYEGEIKGEMSVFDFMDKLRNEGKINFKETNYTGMGKFIEEINGVRNNGDTNWIYYVNSKKANIGVSNYKINKGDIVSWKYEKENF